MALYQLANCIAGRCGRFSHSVSTLLNYRSRRPHLSILSQERLSLVLMYLIGKHHTHGESACTLEDLANAVNLPWEPVADLLDCLKLGGFLVIMDGEAKTYLPAQDTDTILLRNIVAVVRSAGDQVELSISGYSDDTTINFLSNWHKARH